MEVARNAVNDFIQKKERKYRKSKNLSNLISSKRKSGPSDHLKSIGHKGKNKAHEAGDLSESSQNDSSSGDESEECEHAQISRALISKATPSTWISDTGASSHMSDQWSLFRSLNDISRTTIIVGGGKLFSEAKRCVKLICKNGSLMYLQDILLVPNLGSIYCLVERFVMILVQKVFLTSKICFL